MFEWAVWVGTANESKWGWLFGPVTCQQMQHHMFYCEKPEVYHFCLFSHASAQQHEPWSICPSPHALIWQLHPIMVRKGGSGGEAFSTVLARWRMCVEGWLSCDLAGGPSDLQLRKCFCVCVCFSDLKKGTKAILKSSSVALAHALGTSTTCCWSTVGNKRLPKSLVTSLQYPSLTACLCLNTNMPTHN